MTLNYFQPTFYPMKRGILIETAREIGALLEEKNEAYGDAFSKSEKILQVLFPEGVPVEQYCDLLAVTRILDKLFRIATNKDAFGEDPWRDIAGYAILAVGTNKEENEHAHDGTDNP